MKITFILSSLWLSGGVLDIVENTNGLVARGHKITYVIPGQTYDGDVAKVLNPEVQVLQTRTAIARRGVDPEHSTPVSFWEMARLTWQLARLTPASDVVISTQTPTTAAGFLASHVFRRGKPIWYYQDYEEMFIGRPLETWLLRHALSWHTRALVLSESSKIELNKFSSRPVVVVGNGLSHAELFKPMPPAETNRRPSYDNGYLKQRSGVGQNDDTSAQRVLFLGDMRPRKGLYDFLDAMATVRQTIPNIYLWIVSKEDCQISTDLPFEYIYRPARPDLARLYATCDLFVSASWYESFGIPPLEAMACGAPVVMTDSRGGRDYARPGENCLMVPPRNPGALAEAIIRVLSDSSLSEKLRQNGPPTAAQFTWEKIVDRFEKALLSP